MENQGKRDWVKAAVDQWDRERRSRRRRRHAAMSSCIAVIASAILVGITQRNQSSGTDLLNQDISGSVGTETSIERIVLDRAQNRVFGVMNGRELRSRRSMNRLGQGVARLSSRLERKSQLSRVNGS